MNKVILIGRLTREPETRSINNTSLCNFTLAVNRRFAQEGQPNVDYIPIVAWSKLGEFCNNYFTKGMQVAIVGKLQTRTWNDSNGKKHYVTEVIAEEAYFADGKKTSSNKEQSDDFYNLDDSDLPF